MSRKTNRYYEALKEAGELTDEPVPEDHLLPKERSYDRTPVKKTVTAVLLLIAGLTLLEAVLIVIFRNIQAFRSGNGLFGALFGLLLGTVIGLVWFLTMKKQIDMILSGGAAHPNANLKIGAIFRFVGVAAVIAVGVFTGFYNPLTVIIGVINLKIAAFIAGFLLNRGKKEAEKEAPAETPEPPDVDPVLDEILKL
ncbi:MAG: hypothetical protein IK088_04825 [Lachnospiraceae bacterium]|nr:hypothetical protein [Lachnospiraceae bacterium]